MVQGFMDGTTSKMVCNEGAYEIVSFGTLDLYLDSNGNIAATKGLIVDAPWVVRESKNYPGRYFFLNTATKRTAWSLEPRLLGYEFVGVLESRQGPRSGMQRAGMVGRRWLSRHYLRRL